MNKLILISLLSIPLLSSCVPDNSGGQKSVSGATQATVTGIAKNSKGFTSEQQNIQDRINVTTQIGKIMWMHLLNSQGDITKRFPVKNKTTSSGKSLEPSETTGGGEFKKYPYFNGYEVAEFIKPDGTYGSSGDYTYFFDPMGRYHQIGSAGMTTYLLTDYPIDLENQVDKVTGLYQVNQQAANWAAQQEQKLEK